jgi:hypothetical protein
VSPTQPGPPETVKKAKDSTFHLCTSARRPPPVPTALEAMSSDAIRRATRRIPLRRWLASQGFDCRGGCGARNRRSADARHGSHMADQPKSRATTGKKGGLLWHELTLHPKENTRGRCQALGPPVVLLAIEDVSEAAAP